MQLHPVYVFEVLRDAKEEEKTAKTSSLTRLAYLNSENLFDYEVAAILTWGLLMPIDVFKLFQANGFFYVNLTVD